MGLKVQELNEYAKTVQPVKSGWPSSTQDGCWFLVPEGVGGIEREAWARLGHEACTTCGCHLVVEDDHGTWCLWCGN